MQEYTKLGVFYLGQLYDPDANKRLLDDRLDPMAEELAWGPHRQDAQGTRAPAWK